MALHVHVTGRWRNTPVVTGEVGPLFLSLAKKEFRAKASKYKRKFISKVTEVVEVSQLGCVGSGDKLQRQEKGPGNLGERKAKVMHGGGGKKRGRERYRHAL